MFVGFDLVKVCFFGLCSMLFVVFLDLIAGLYGLCCLARLPGFGGFLVFYSGLV